MTDQFGSFDGRDNRKTVMDLFVKMGNGLSERVAGMKRAGFLQGLIYVSTSFLFSNKLMVVEPCSAVEAYNIMVAICTALGVDITEATELLQEVVANQYRMQEPSPFTARPSGRLTGKGKSPC